MMRTLLYIAFSRLRLPFGKSTGIKLAGPVNSTMDVYPFLEQERP